MNDEDLVEVRKMLGVVRGELEVNDNPNWRIKEDVST